MAHRFLLSLADLVDMAHDFATGIQLGLSHNEQEIKALVTYVRPQPARVREALVVDLGGTRVRAARVQVGPEMRIVAGPATAELPITRGVPLPRIDYLSVQTELLSQVASTTDLPLGYCFSYPAASQTNGDAILLNWTKEVFVPDTEGLPVGAMLADAARAVGVAVGKVTVVNDTVAALLAGLAGPPADGYLGLIVGTGTNLALQLVPGQIPKLPGGLFWPTPLPVNLESGNYSPPCLNRVDREVDARSDTPGSQRFEKAVSGVYLGRLLSRAAPAARFDGSRGSAGVVAVARKDDDLGRLAQAILNRSADLIAASLAGATLIYGDHARLIRVVAEGGLFWGAPGYRARVETTLAQLLPAVGRGQTRVELVGRDQANLFGAALAT
jgi:hexokinase